MRKLDGVVTAAAVRPGRGHVPPAVEGLEVDVVLTGSSDGLLSALAGHLQARGVRLQALRTWHSHEGSDDVLDVRARLALPRGMLLGELEAGLVDALADQLFDVDLRRAGGPPSVVEEWPSTVMSPRPAPAPVAPDEDGMPFAEVLALLRRHSRSTAPGQRRWARPGSAGAAPRIELDAPALGGPAVAARAPSAGVVARGTDPARRRDRFGAGARG